MYLPYMQVGGMFHMTALSTLTCRQGHVAHGTIHEKSDKIKTFTARWTSGLIARCADSMGVWAVVLTGM